VLLNPLEIKEVRPLLDSYKPLLDSYRIA
jgi:hypothetical protein